MARHEVESEVTGNVWKILLEVGADVAGVGLDVGVVHESDEFDLRRLERVRGGEDEGEGEGTSGVGGGGRSRECGRPLVNVVVDQLEGDVLQRGLLEGHELLFWGMSR